MYTYKRQIDLTVTEVMRVQNIAYYKFKLRTHRTECLVCVYLRTFMRRRNATGNSHNSKKPVNYFYRHIRPQSI